MDFFVQKYLEFQNALKSEEGQTMAEYGLLLALIAVAVVIGAITLLGPAIGWRVHGHHRLPRGVPRWALHRQTAPATAFTRGTRVPAGVIESGSQMPGTFLWLKANQNNERGATRTRREGATVEFAATAARETAHYPAARSRELGRRRMRCPKRTRVGSRMGAVSWVLML